jgi:AraC-like DNA-binding protein
MRRAVSSLWPAIPAWHRRWPFCSMTRRTHGRCPSSHACATCREPRDLLTDIRMTLAANELRKSSLSTGAVAAIVGYQSQAAFQRAFKSHMGVTPAQWRKMQEPPGRDIFARPAAPAEGDELALS